MTLRSILLSFLLVAMAVTTHAAPALPAPSNPAGFAIRRGINISHWLSQDFGWAPREKWFTEKDVRFIAKQGFDHIRLPVDEKELWSAEGRPIESEFKRLVSAIDWCQKAGLRVIVDLHTLNSHHFNAANEGLKITLWTDPAKQEHLFALWRDLSAALRHFPASVLAYEILNEPVADDPEDWCIAVGDMVRIFNDRGSFVAKARVTDKARKGLVVGLSVWWKKLASDGKNANEVTSQRLTDMGRAPTFYDTLVEVEKVA